MKVYKNKKGYYCRAYNKATKSTVIIHGDTQAEALHKAHSYEMQKHTGSKMTFEQAYKEMTDGRVTLSPSTLRGYKSAYNTHLKEFGKKKLSQINSKTVQKIVDDLARKRSPKTVANVYGLISSVLAFHDARGDLKVKLPVNHPKKKKLPSTDEIKALIDNCEDEELKLILKCSVHAGLRRGESCALTNRDVFMKGDRYYLSITKAWAEDENHKWVLKDPKSYEGYRDVEIPESLAKEIMGKKGSIIKCTPSAITCRYIKYAEKQNFKYNMHILRHWSASYLKHKGVSDAEVMQRFGWSSLSMLKVYVDIIDSESQTTKAINTLSEALK